MTALAVALVLCCAMVCGTYLLARRYGLREVEAQVTNAANGAARQELELLGLEFASTKRDLRALRDEVDSLKAQAAFRSTM